MARVFSWIIEADKIGYAYITNGKSGTAEEPLLTIEKLGDETDEFKSIFRRANSMSKTDYDRLFYKMKDMINDEFNIIMEGESGDYFGEDQNYILLSGRNGDGLRVLDLSGGKEQRKAALDEFAAYWYDLGNADLNGAMFIARGLTLTAEAPENDTIMTYTSRNTVMEGYNGFIVCPITDTSNDAEIYSVHIALDGTSNIKAVRDNETRLEVVNIERTILPLNYLKIEDAEKTYLKKEDGSVTETNLSSDLQSKVNNNVKYVEQNLDNTQAKIAAKNVLMKDADGNFYLGSDFYSRAINPASSAKPSHCVFGTNFRNNKFGVNVNHNTFGNNVYDNTFGHEFAANVVGNNVSDNIFESFIYVRHNIFGNNVKRNKFLNVFDSNHVGNDVQDNQFGNYGGGVISDNIFSNNIRNCNFCRDIRNSRFDGNMYYVNIESQADENNPLQNIHVLSGIKGESNTNRLTISIPDKYLNSSRELIITTKVTNGGASTADDIVMYYADEVVDKQDKTDATLATTDKTIVGAINELKASSVGGNFEWSYSSDTESSKIYVQKVPTYKVPNGAEGGDFTVGETLLNMPIFVMEYQTSNNRKLKRYLDPYLSWKPFSTIGPQPTGEYTWLPVIAYANRSGLTFYNKITGLYLVKKNGEFLKGSNNGSTVFYTFNKNGQTPQSTDVPTTTYANAEPIYIIGGQDSTDGCGWDMSETFTVKNGAEELSANYPGKIDTTDNDFITAGYSVDTGGNGVDGSADGKKLDSSINKFTIFEITFNLAQFGEGGEIEYYATPDINEKEYYFGIQGAIKDGKQINYLIAVNSSSGVLPETTTGTAAWTAKTSTDRSLLTIMNEGTGINTNSESKFVEYYDAASATPPITDKNEVSYLHLENNNDVNTDQKFYPVGRTFAEVTKAGSNIAYYLGYIGQK